MSGQSSGQTAQASTLRHLPNPPPLTDNVDAHAAGSRSYQQENQDLREDVVLAQDESSHRRHKPRSSGGFLLQGTPAPTSSSVYARHTEPDVSENVRGKRKAVEGDISVSKRGTARHRHRQQASLGSSPLATEVVNVQNPDPAEGSGASESDSRLSSNANSTRSGNTSNGASMKSTSVTGGITQNSGRSTVGLDTDPAQIVSLALTLSESRRRNLSVGGLIAPRDAVGVKRLASPIPPSLALPNSTGGGSLRQHLQQQRRGSRNISPRSSGSAGLKGAEPLGSQKEHAIRKHQTIIADVEAGLHLDTVVKVSDATLARAQKARVTFELHFEYRRLLRYLPMHPSPTKSRQTATKATTRPQGAGTVYNPLQYIRNRKLRIREREPLDAEGDGWNNIECVRAWVDQVANEWEDGIFRIDKRLPLPPLDQSPNGLPRTDDLQAQNKTQAPDPQVKRPSRPHMDWIITPWDLLADVKWLFQDENINRIVDREGQPLVPKGGALQEDRPRNSMESIKDPVRKPEGLLRHINSSPERLRASLDGLRGQSRERGRRWPEVLEPNSPVSEDETHQRRRRWPKTLTLSRSSSSSGESHRAARRGHGRVGDHFGSRDDLEHAALEKQMMNMLAQEARDKPEGIGTVNHQAVEGAEATRESYDHGTANGKASKPSQRRPSTPQRMKADMPAAAKHPSPVRVSLDEQKLQHYRMSSEDFDSTAPSSPITSGFIPSIAINLSPPASPQNSTVSPVKRTLPSRVDSFRRNRSHSMNRRAVSENIAVTDSGTSTDISRQTTNESQLHSMLLKERSKHSVNGFLSPTKADTGANKYRAIEIKSVKSIKETGGLDSKLKGFLKGGRIAEIVGNEVSRVGDLLWRKESNNVSEMNPEPLSFAPDESDADEGDISGMENSPRNNLSREITNTDGIGKLSHVSTNNEKPRYHMNNLPTFRSTFSNDEPTSRATKGTPEQDHIARQQLALRERGRSSRFDRLAPSQIDMRGISPSPGRLPSPNRAYLQAILGEDPGGSSRRSRSAQRVRNVNKKLNAVLAIPGRLMAGPAPTVLAGLESRPEDIKERAKSESKRQWSIADRGVSSAQESITKRDIARVRALLLSSGVKANEIIRRAEEIPERPSPMLFDLIDLFKGSIPEVSRSREHVIAARILVSTIDTTTQRLRDSAERFSKKMNESLHNQIKAIEERVTHELTPLARASADGAEEFSTELTTTHTLAIKQLNDSIDGILRRRRRRLRWIRRGGWAMLEWALLGIMWMIWFFVVIVRLMRSVVSGFVRTVRWVLWL